MSDVKKLAYILVVTMLSPVFTIGLFFYMVPIVLKRGKVSGTAYEPFNARLLYHLVGNRPDPEALKLAHGLPATNRAVMGTLIKPLAWVSRVTGYLPAMVEFPPARPIAMSALMGARCEFLDEAMHEFIAPGDQVVILGAGWDTRAYGLLKDKQVSLFEVDAPATQAVKRAAIDKTNIDASSVTFVSCDFNRQSWLDALTESGFNPNKRTFILWEGVTMYLEEATIQNTLKAVAALPPGSRIACDFFSREWLDHTRVGKAAQRAAKFGYGERLFFGFPVKPEFTSALAEYMDACGLSLVRSRPMGDESDGGLPFGGLILAETPAADDESK